jgi:hypothetical protein
MIMAILKLLSIILFLFVITFVGVEAKKKKGSTGSSVLDKKIKSTKEELRKTKCAHILDELNNQCVNYYLNPRCYEQVYGDRGFEWGEVNFNKDNEFESCHKKSAK